MEYKIIEEVSYNLHLIKTNKFKTLFFKVILSEKLKKEDITIRNLLIDNLMSSSKKYKTMRELNIKKQDLYGVSVNMVNRRIGDYSFIEYTMNMLNKRFTEESMLKESIQFFSELLYEPNVSNGLFDNELFEVSKKNIKKELEMEKERPNSYAFDRFKEVLDKDAAFSYSSIGYEKDLENITSEDLYKYYKKTLDNSVCDIYVVGDFDFDEVEQLIKDNFKFNTKCRPSSYSILLKDNKRNNEVIQESSFNQSRLFIGFKLTNFNEEDKKYPLSLFNMIFGNSPESKLFKEVREEKSLCYSISSSYRRLDNFYYINAGISYNNYDEVLNTIKKCLKDMQEGNFDEESLEKAKTVYLSALKETFDTSASIVEFYFANEYFDNDSYEEQLELHQKVTKEDIIRVANLLEIDTIYLLKEAK